MKHSKLFLVVVASLALATFWGGKHASAQMPLPPDPQSSSIGLEATISTAPPKQGATIAAPANGQSFSSIPVQVSGLCPTGTLVKIFANNVFVGSVMCATGSYSTQIDLFSGRNDIVTRVFDALDQAGPDSNVVTVTFNDAQFAQFGTRVSLTSDYATRGANPGETLTWPVALSGGTGPYALSVDWGDGKTADLMSQISAGVVNLTHVYDSAGVYNVIIKATDKNGTTAFLRVVGVGNGKAAISASNSSGKNTPVVTNTKVLWWPVVVLIPLLGVTFWLGQRHELFTIRRSIEKSRDEMS